MKSIIEAMKDRGDYNKENYYLFVIEKAENESLNGLMPFNSHFGFIFTGNNSQTPTANSQKLYRTIAHELAHGAFKLKHNFDDKKTEKRSTQNLLDYSTTPETAIVLRKFQWDEIISPRAIAFGWSEELYAEGEISETPEYYFSINYDSIAIKNQVLNVTESNRNFKIKLHCKNDSANLDNIYLLVNSDTIKSTNVSKKFLNDMYIIAQKTGSSDTLSFLDIKVDHDSLYIKFTTKSSYKGEFGFDDGKDFSSISVPKTNMVYDTIHNSNGDVLYSPFITMNPNSTISIKANIRNKMPEYNYIAETSNDNITCSYNATTSDLQITNSNYTNDFISPDYIYIYRKDKNNIEPKQLIGKCEVISKNIVDTSQVYIIYYKPDTVSFTNTIVPSDLKDNLNNHSLNQAFKQFYVDNIAYTIIDSTAIDSIHFRTVTKAYQRIYGMLMLDKMSNPGKYKSNSFFVIMSDLVFPVAGVPGAYSGGGVMSNSPYAVMWKVPFLTSANYPELITHEGGHVFQLKDTFNDSALGNPAQAFSRHNYMDYFIPRNMFFKTQIKTMFNYKLQ